MTVGHLTVTSTSPSSLNSTSHTACYQNKFRVVNLFFSTQESLLKNKEFRAFDVSFSFLILSVLLPLEILERVLSAIVHI
jgi:hypothetical protein